MTADWLAVEAHLVSGDVVAAMSAYRGPLLPRSVAPGVVRLRTDVELSLREAVLRYGQRNLTLLPLITGQIARLDRDLGS